MDSKERNLVIKTLLNKLSLTTKRSSFVNIKLRKFGTFHTHGNKKRLNKLKYLRRYNKESWKQKRENDLKDINYLLF